METKLEEINWFGLLGRNIEYSFSRNYFAEKFNQLQRSDCRYVNFDIEHIDLFPNILKQYPSLKGFNVTIPYKETIIPFLDDLSDTARAIGAVNCVQVTSGRLLGHNTDAFGFQKSIENLVQPHHQNALILGSGGASKAVNFALQQLGISSQIVSRNVKNDQLSYADLNNEVMSETHLIINTTPLGTHPNVDDFPPIPFEFITPQHVVVDLIYNPEKTLLLQKCENRGAVILNGYDMLVQQAEKSWEIWNS